MGPLVSVNKGTPEEIARLYGIGPRLAKRIVIHREIHGYFRTPEDLAKVEGVSLHLARTLTPHIDWRVPGEPGWFKERQWGIALLGIVITVVLFIGLLGFGTTPFPRIMYRLGAPWDWVISIWVPTSVFASAVCLILLCVAMIVGALTRDRTQLRQFTRIWLMLLGPMMLAFISWTLSNAVYYQLYSVWPDFLEARPSWVGTASLVGLTLYSWPFMLIGWRPDLVNSFIALRLLGFVHHAAMALGGVLLVLGIWGDRHGLALWELALWNFTGLVLAGRGVIAIRRRESFWWSGLIELMRFTPTVLTYPEDEIDAWKAWINTYLAAPEQQRMLKRALDEAYPSSKGRALINVAVFTAVSWLVLNALSAFLEWLLQGWLDRVFPWFK